MKKTLQFLLIAFSLVLVMSAPVMAQIVFAGGGHGIDFRNLSTSDPAETLVPSASVPNPRGIFVDSSLNRVYFVNGGTAANRGLYSAGTDGSNLQQLYVFGNTQRALAGDPVNQILYAADSQFSRIYKIGYDGTALGEIFNNAGSGTYGVALSSDYQSIYWTESTTKRVLKGNVNGTGQEVLFDGEADATHLALDSKNNVLYWVSGNTIRRGNVDGTGAENFYTVSSGVLAGLQVYDDQLWMINITASGISSIGLDGSGYQVEWGRTGHYLAIVPESSSWGLFLGVAAFMCVWLRRRS